MAKVPRDQIHRTVPETADADLGTLEVDEHAHVPAQLPRDLANAASALAVAIMAVVGEVESDHVDPGRHHVAQNLGVVRGRT